MQMDFYECMYGKTAAWMSGAELRQASTSSMSNLLCWETSGNASHVLLMSRVWLNKHRKHAYLF